MRQVPKAANSDGTLRLVRVAAKEALVVGAEKSVLRGIFAWIGTSLSGPVGVAALAGDLFPGDTPIREHIVSTPVIDKPRVGTDAPTWAEEMEKSAQLAAEIATLQQQIRLMEKWGLGGWTYILKLQLDGLYAQGITPAFANRVQVKAQGSGGDTANLNAASDITQIEKNIRHVKTLEWFTPSRRTLLLMNFQDADDPDYSWNPTNGRDRYLADFEIAATGRFQDMDRLQKLDASVMADAQAELHRTATAYDSWAQEPGDETPSPRRSTLPVEQIIRISPDQDLATGLGNAAKALNTKDPQQLTYIVILAHGIDLDDDPISHNAISMGSPNILLYSELIRFLDTVPGKKVVVMSGCYSGNLIDLVAQHPRRTDYVVIADTSADELSVGINQLMFMSELAGDLIHERPISHMRRGTVSLSRTFGERSQTPTIFVGFDTIL